MWRIWLFVFIYTLTPLSSSVLFTAAAMAKVKAARTVPPFFFGKLISDAVMVFTGNYSARHIAASSLSVKAAVIMASGRVIIAAFLFVDWRTLLQQKRLRFNIVWKFRDGAPEPAPKSDG